MKLNRETGEDIQGVEREIFKRISVSSTGLRQKIRMEVNILDYAIGEVLSIEYEDKQWRPVAFLSKSLNKIKGNYKVHDKEILAVIRGLENWRHLLEGTKFKFEVWMDYKNLDYFMKAQKLNRKQVYWIFYLLRFNFTLKHILGTKIEKTDRLSRRLDWKVSIEKNNEFVVEMK